MPYRDPIGKKENQKEYDTRRRCKLHKRTYDKKWDRSKRLTQRMRELANKFVCECATPLTYCIFYPVHNRFRKHRAVRICCVNCGKVE